MVNELPHRQNFKTWINGSVLLKAHILLLFLLCLACNNTNEEESENEDGRSKTEIEFDKTKWRKKVDNDYPFRDQMLNGIVYNDTVRTLNKKEVLGLLGEPDRIDSNYLFYIIAQKRIGFFPLHTKTMVVKFSNDSTIDWIKIHE